MSFSPSRQSAPGQGTSNIRDAVVQLQVFAILLDNGSSPDSIKVVEMASSLFRPCCSACLQEVQQGFFVF
jgi:hypothetical protein